MRSSLLVAGQTHQGGERISSGSNKGLERRGVLAQKSGVTTQKVAGKALITGASGFIGSRLRDALLADGVDVVAIRRRSSPPSKKGRSVAGDYADAAGLAEIIAEEKPDYVFHVAGATKGRTLEDFRRGNVMPTRNLIDAVKREHPGLRRFVFVSSLTVYGPSTPERPAREEDPRRPVEHYGRSKLEAERLLEAVGDAFAWTIVRPSAVYGPGDVDFLELFKGAARGLNPFFGNEHRWMSKIYVDDCVRGILAAASADAAVGNGYMLCDDEPVTWGRMQAAIVGVMPRRVVTLRLPEALTKIAAIGGEVATMVDKKPRLFNRQKVIMGEQEAWTCTGEAATRDFGFRCEVALDEGVRLTDAWYREHGWY